MNFFSYVKNSKENDEYYTPAYAVEPLLEYLKPFNKIWCPFDTSESNYVKVLKNDGHEVINTHIFSNQDFFEIENIDCDAIVSNPPYSLKNEVLEKLFSLKKPFAMLLGGIGLFDSKKRFDMFSNNPFEIMYFNKRVAFFNNERGEFFNPPFSSVYITSRILPEKIIFKTLNKESRRKKQ